MIDFFCRRNGIFSHQVAAAAEEAAASQTSSSSSFASGEMKMRRALASAAISIA